MTRHTDNTLRVLRFVVLMTVVTLMGLSTAGKTSAEGDNDSYDNTIIQISACKLAGGEAEVGQLQTGSGFYATSVDCNGGLLDGMACSNTPDHGSNCHWRDDEVPERRVQPTNDNAAKEPAGIAPLDEPTATPVVVVEPVQSVEETMSDGSETVTPKATEEPVQDEPMVDEATATPEPGGEVIQDPVIDTPLVSDGGAIAPEITEEPIVIEPEIGGKTVDGIDRGVPGEGSVVGLGY